MCIHVHVYMQSVNLQCHWNQQLHEQCTCARQQTAMQNTNLSQESDSFPRFIQARKVTLCLGIPNVTLKINNQSQGLEWQYGGESP